MFFFVLHPISDSQENMISSAKKLPPVQTHSFRLPGFQAEGHNDWVFATLLDQRLFPILQQHSVDKPIMVFCPTRKG